MSNLLPPLTPCPRRAIHQIKTLVPSLVDLYIVDPGSRSRFLAGPKLRLGRARQPVKAGRVTRPLTLNTVWESKTKTWPGAYRRHLVRTDIRDLLEHLFIASHVESAGSAGSDEESEGADADADTNVGAEFKEGNDADLISFLCWRKKGGRVRRSEKKLSRVGALARPNTV